MESAEGGWSVGEVGVDGLADAGGLGVGGSGDEDGDALI